MGRPALTARKESPEVYPVHRLDKATTGTLLLAKSSLQASRLAKQLANHEVQRQYLAVVHGQLKVGYRGELDGRLRVDPDRVRVCGEDEGVEAKTIWECLATSPRLAVAVYGPEAPTQGTRFCKVRLFLFPSFPYNSELISSPQIAAPIVGDFKYAPKAPHAESLTELSIPNDRILLHSSSISFYTWGKNGKRQTITASAPPSPALERFCRAHSLALPK
ncbi:SPOSA6832_00465 [Sporobolomyces salmonicolor]|uniref:SPOSA6832_00465-mRNA-1:cds n=1 Tax=Sporidiobolus salmonicolor TaxID=5005 RepID=A0A0D6EG44_SPOSA|nr:SPOSA6832_00465 [Sporobolomyces salmonicolor]